MPHKILLVDDDPVFLHVYASLLGQHFETDAAEGAHQALEMIDQHGPYAVIIADMQMPGMDGLTFLSRIDDLSPQTFKIMFTGHPNLSTIMSAVNELNIFGFFSKDCDSAELIAKVREAMAEYTKRRRSKNVSSADVLSAEEKAFLHGSGDDDKTAS